jgi:hypothetical protein
VALSPLQERIAALIAGLPESERFVLAGGAALAAHGLLDRTTRDLDYFAGPEDVAAVQQLAEAFEATAASQGLSVQRERQGESFVRFSVSDGRDQCELDLAIDYRALEPVETSYGPAFDLRELGANKVLAIFDRAEPRDFIDLAQVTEHFPLQELIALAAAKDPGLDLAVLEEFLNRARVFPPADFELDGDSYARLLEVVRSWQLSLRDLRRRELGPEREGDSS